MKSKLATYSAFLLALFFAIPVFAGQEKKISLDEVPAALMEKAKEIVAQEQKFKQEEIQITNAQIETEDDGKKTYEIQGSFASGRKIEVDLFENGEVEEYEIEFNKQDVPMAVLKGIERKIPGFEPTFIEASHSPSGKVLKYEFEGTVNGNHMDIEVSADGRRIEVADN